MYDKRVARGSTYAAMVIPAGTNPDAMMMDKKGNETRKTKSFNRSNHVNLAVINLNRSSSHLVTDRTSTLTETYPLLSPCPADFTWKCRLRSTWSSSLINHLRGK
jgi:hypothetical protein